MSAAAAGSLSFTPFIPLLPFKSFTLDCDCDGDRCRIRLRGSDGGAGDASLNGSGCGGNRGGILGVLGVEAKGRREMNRVAGIEIPGGGIGGAGHGFSLGIYVTDLGIGIARWASQSFAVRRPSVVAAPTEVRDAFAELAGDGRRQPGVDVFEAALPRVALGGGVELQEPLPALARGAGARIEEQVRFGG
jgi:hypothetical protein